MMCSLILSGCETAPVTANMAVAPQISVSETPAPETAVADIAAAETSLEAEPEPTDLWHRIRGGYNLSPEEMHKTVEKQLQWYVRNPRYLATVFERAEPFIFYVTDELDSAGLPLELALLPIVESTYDPLAYSHSHAVGLWQFIPSTARSFGLQRDRWYDGRRDVIYSTQAAVKYLSYLHRRFDQDWLLALAAYNSGEGNVRKSMARNRKKGKPTDFWSIKLPRETRNYVPQLLALATLIANPKEYGIELPTIADAPYFEVVKIKSQIDLNKVVDISGLKGADFTRLNPAYRRSITPPKGVHNILLPVGTAQPLRDLLANTDPKTWVPHTEYAVTSGDTLSEIAQRFRIPTSWLKRRNSLTSDRLRVGQVLFIPHSGDSETGILAGKGSATGTTQKSNYQVQRGDTLSGIAQRYKTSTGALRQANGLTTDVLQIGQTLVVEHAAAIEVAENLRRLSYRVRRGDSLYLIAEKFDLRIRDITRWNKISRNEYLQPGQRLTLFINALRI
jgi:membrane-bound lytic murein transglycosylase D